MAYQYIKHPYAGSNSFVLFGGFRVRSDGPRNLLDGRFKSVEMESAMGKQSQAKLDDIS